MIAPPRKPMPDWLVDRLVRNGLMDGDNFATRKARAATCPRCHRAIFIGIDRDWGGMAVECDPEPLTAMGESLALLAHRRTFELWASGLGPMTLDARDVWRIQGRPAGRSRVDVLVQHDCDLVGRLPTGPSVYPPSTRPEDLPDDPPY